jgi:hypothetical protein
MRERPTVQRLGGDRLHLQHGPIDVVLKAWGRAPDVARAYDAAAARFQTVLGELVEELALLRQPLTPPNAPPSRVRETTPMLAMAPAAGPIVGRLELARSASPLPSGPVARRMMAACLPFADLFVTPMAAVAGAVADELLAAMLSAAPLDRAFVNDGGDIAIHLGPGESMTIGIAGDREAGAERGWEAAHSQRAKPRAPVEARAALALALNGRLRLRASDGVGGVATSGRHGRSFSLGIADSVTVLARNAAIADAAATLIANAVDIDSPAIARRPAASLDPDSDLGDLPVTVDVGPLAPAEIGAALDAGRRRAEAYLRAGLIAAAALTLRGRTVIAGEGFAPRRAAIEETAL